MYEYAAIMHEYVFFLVLTLVIAINEKIILFLCVNIKKSVIFASNWF